jgi:hypothetical protein
MNLKYTFPYGGTSPKRKSKSLKFIRKSHKKVYQHYQKVCEHQIGTDTPVSGQIEPPRERWARLGMR